MIQAIPPLSSQYFPHPQMYSSLPRWSNERDIDYEPRRADHTNRYASLTNLEQCQLREEEDIGPADTEMNNFFRMYCFKVQDCQQTRPHDWTKCSHTHPGETAKRRDLFLYTYSGDPCPDFRWKGPSKCPRGDRCNFSHGVFECWLHPDQYRTSLCEDGLRCRRKVCFFAHTVDQLRAPGRHDFQRIQPTHNEPTIDANAFLSSRHLIEEPMFDSAESQIMSPPRARPSDDRYQECSSSPWTPWTSEGIFTRFPLSARVKSKEGSDLPTSVVPSSSTTWSLFTEDSLLFRVMDELKRVEDGKKQITRDIEHKTCSTKLEDNKIPLTQENSLTPDDQPDNSESVDHQNVRLTRDIKYKGGSTKFPSYHVPFTQENRHKAGSTKVEKQIVETYRLSQYDLLMKFLEAGTFCLANKDGKIDVSCSNGSPQDFPVDVLELLQA